MSNLSLLLTGASLALGVAVWVTVRIWRNNRASYMRSAEWKTKAAAYKFEERIKGQRIG